MTSLAHTRSSLPAGLTGVDQQRVAAALASSRAANTRTSYAGAWARFEQWAQARGSQALPAAPETVAAYLAERAETKAPATVALDRAGLAAAHKGAGLEDPTAHPGVRQVLAGLRRAGRSRGRGQVDGLDWRAADLTAALAGNGSLAGLRDAALILAGSDALLRVSELAALEWADVRLDGADGAGSLTVASSKTDQEGQGHTRFLGAPTVRALRRWRQAAGLEDGAVFRSVNKGGRVGGRLDSRNIRRIIGARAQAAGIQGRVSGHSLRIGAAQSLAAAGAGLVELQQAGDWKSPAMPAHYARQQLAARGAVARLRYGGGS